MHTVALSSSDGRFNVSVAGDDTELIASMLLLLEVPHQAAHRALDQVSQRRQQRSDTSTVIARVKPAPAA
jgi:hypothetical protein